MELGWLTEIVKGVDTESMEDMTSVFFGTDEEGTFGMADCVSRLTWSDHYGQTGAR